MDEENKIIGMSGDEENTIPEENVTPEETQAEELENLAETFRAAYDETVAEAEAEEETEPADEPAYEAEPEVEKPAKKVKKPRSKAATVITTVILTILCIIFAVVAIALVGMKLFTGSINPENMQTTFISDTSTYDENMKEGAAAAALIGTEEETTAEDDSEDSEDTESTDYYSTALTAYKAAVSACTDDTWYCNRCKKKALSAAVTLILENENYQEAYSYLSSSIDLEDAENYSSEAVQSVLETAEQVSSAAGKAVTEVLAGGDVETVCKSYNLPDDVYDVFKGAVSSIADTFEDDKADAAIDGKNDILTAYYNAYTSLVDIGADSNELAENLCAALYENGCLYTAISFASVMSEDYEATSEGFAALEDAEDNIKETYSTLFETAVKAEEEGKTGAEALADDSNDESVKALVASVIDLCIEGIKAENERNLTEAADKYYSAISTAQMFEIEDATLIYRYLKATFDMGSIPTANSDAETLVTDSVKAAFTEEQTAGYEKMQQVFTALNTASEVFSSYYTNYYYYGTEIDMDALSEELDALITEESNNYDKAFVAYCKYYAALSTGDDDAVDEYLAAMKENAPDLPFVYGYFELSEYVEDGDMEKAVKLADELLEVNIADDYSIAVKALEKRLEKDYAGAVKIAENGIELLGADSATYCSKEAGVAYMLAGNYEKAYDNLYACYQNNLTLENADLMLILQYLAGDDSELADDLEAVAEEIEETYTSYSVTSLTDTLDILAGKKDAETVLTSGNGNLQNED